MYELHKAVAVIRLYNPPVNSLGHALRMHIHAAMLTAQADEAVRAVVLIGSDKAFSAGADVNEFGKPAQAAPPILLDLMACIEASTKPVVAAISGMALGGGLELALCCHGRVALASAQLGLPEVTLGLIPGAGGTQRLPRLVSVEAAYALMHTGIAQSARQLESSGLLDKVVDLRLSEEACALALELSQSAHLPRARDKVPDATRTHRFVAEQRTRLTPRQCKLPAYAAVLDALVASAGDFDQGMRVERALFQELLGSMPAKALRYQFLSEREATKLPAIHSVRPRAVQTLGIVGAGTMGAGIAISALDAGLKVVLIEQDIAALQRGQARISGHYDAKVEAGKMKSVVAAATEARLLPTVDWTQLSQADFIIEAVFEDIAVKQQVFREIDIHARPGAVLATNTSYLDVDSVAAATGRPQDVVGLHFFSPANVMKLLEVVRASRTAPDVLATCMALGKTLRKIPVQTGNAFGFIGNRVYNAYRKQCEFMLEDGALPEEVDAALEDFGFAMGPFKVADLSGLDIAWRMRQAQSATRDPRERYVDILDQLCEMGRLGRKTGAGYYNYTHGKPDGAVDATVRRIIESASVRRGIIRRSLAPQDIQQRALLAMVNEAALLLSEGVASRASDVDVVLVQGYGFARWQGGPVFWAQQQNHASLTQAMQALAEVSGGGLRLADLSVLFAV